MAQVSYGFTSTKGVTWVQGSINGTVSELYPLADGVAIINGEIPCYIDYSELELVGFEPGRQEAGEERLSFDLCLEQKGKNGGKEAIRVEGIAYREYFLLRDCLAEKSVPLAARI